MTEDRRDVQVTEGPPIRYANIPEHVVTLITVALKTATLVDRLEALIALTRELMLTPGNEHFRDIGRRMLVDAESQFTELSGHRIADFGKCLTELAHIKRKYGPKEEV